MAGENTSSAGPGTPAEEYREVGVNWRYWGETRFKQLTVFLTATGVLGAAAGAMLDGSRISSLGASAGVKPVALAFLVTAVRVAFAALGSLVAGLFFVLEERATYYRRSYLHRALELERTLKFEQYHVSFNPYWKFRSEHVFRAFFTAVFLIWICYGVAVTDLHLAVRATIITLAVVATLAAWELGNNLQIKVGVEQSYNSRKSTAANRPVHPRQPLKGLVFAVAWAFARVRNGCRAPPRQEAARASTDVSSATSHESTPSITVPPSVEDHQPDRQGDGREDTDA